MKKELKLSALAGTLAAILIIPAFVFEYTLWLIILSTLAEAGLVYGFWLIAKKEKLSFFRNASLALIAVTIFPPQ